MSSSSSIQISDCDGSKYALVPYTVPILSDFYEKSKTFTFNDDADVIQIKQHWTEHGVAGVVWEGALVLCEYLSKDLTSIQHKTVIELGSGTGLAGIFAAKKGAHVTLTDVEKTLPALQENVNLNFQNGSEDPQAPKVQALQWHSDNKKFTPCAYDIIIGADIIYSEALFDDLLSTLVHLTSNCPEQNLDAGPKVILSSKLRYDRVETFISRLRTAFRFVNEVYKDTSRNVLIIECHSLVPSPSDVT